ncbi:MAG TPA: hypothetical protein VFG63_00250 [Nocardioidaceae bacterium]|nr:hypothetical protein [Nocardioidaceae bacterium]
MNRRLELRDLAEGVRRLWWIPALLVIAGGVVGMTASSNVPVVYRSESTVLVGPTDGAVTHSSTIRASENLATFYADMARRQIVLQPVVRRLDLGTSWVDLKNRVSSVVPAQNLRLVTVTVSGETQDETDATADAIMEQLVSLSPVLPGGNEQAFINEQADNLKAMIEEGQDRIDALQSEMKQSSDSAQRDQLNRQIVEQEQMVGDWQGNFVELIAAEPSSDAGGLQVLDEASAVTDMGRSGVAKQVLVGAFVGGVLGIVIAWLIHGYVTRRRLARKERRHAAVPAAGGDTGGSTIGAGIRTRPTAAMGAVNGTGRTLTAGWRRADEANEGGL